MYACSAYADVFTQALEVSLWTISRGDCTLRARTGAIAHYSACSLRHRPPSKAATADTIVGSVTNATQSPKVLQENAGGKDGSPDLNGQCQSLH